MNRKIPINEETPYNRGIPTNKEMLTSEKPPSR